MTTPEGATSTGITPPPSGRVVAIVFLLLLALPFGAGFVVGLVLGSAV